MSISKAFADALARRKYEAVSAQLYPDANALAFIFGLSIKGTGEDDCERWTSLYVADRGHGIDYGTSIPEKRLYVMACEHQRGRKTANVTFNGTIGLDEIRALRDLLNTML